MERGGVVCSRWFSAMEVRHAAFVQVFKRAPGGVHIGQCPRESSVDWTMGPNSSVGMAEDF